jgi:hypothetical protein
MSAILYAFTCLCVVWLAIWTMLPKPYTKPTWWPYTWFPFDMLEDAAPPPPVEAATPEALPPSRGGSPFKRDWTVRVARDAAAEISAAIPVAPTPPSQTNWRGRAGEQRQKPSGRGEGRGDKTGADPARR